MWGNWLPQHTSPYLPVTIGLLVLIITLEIWPAAYKTIGRMRVAGILLGTLKLLALLSAGLAIWFLGLAPLRRVILGSLLFCGMLTLYREFDNRWRAGDRSWSSLFGGLTVVIQFLSLVILAGAAVASLLTLLLGPVQALQSESLANGFVVAWVENFAGALWLLTLYYGLFYLNRYLFGGTGFSWMDPSNWRALLPHLKYLWTISRGRPAKSRLADTVRMTYIRSIIKGDSEISPLGAIERAAHIWPLPDSTTHFSFAVIGDPGEGDKSQINPWAREGQIAVFRKAISEIDQLEKAAKSQENGQDSISTPGFLIISSDVAYPSGELMDYERALYRPYRTQSAEAAIPIYALPGNHDWYNNLRGFMLNFTYAAAHEKGTPWMDPLHHGPWSRHAFPWEWLRWREVGQLRERYGLTKLGGVACQPATQQRLPFFEMSFKHAPLTILGVDTGCSGSIDPLQRAWLRRRLHRNRALGHLIFVLLSQPVYADGAFIGGDGMSDIYELLREYEVDIVMGGDTHSFQHYEVRHKTASGRIHTTHHIVNGGGGAYLSWPVDFTWRMAFTPGPLDEAFVYHDPATRARDEVILHRIFPSAAEMRDKFSGYSTDGPRLRRWLRRYEPWFLRHGLTNALDHDRPPLQQSFITAEMAYTGSEEHDSWELQLTPWFSDSASGELLPQEAIKLQAPTRVPIWLVDST